MSDYIRSHLTYGGAHIVGKWGEPQSTENQAMEAHSNSPQETESFQQPCEWP